MSLVGFAKSNKGLEFGWAQPDDQDQFYQRLSRNLRLIDAQLHNQWAHDPDTSFELSFAFFGGVISGESAWLIIPDGKVALTDDATNFVERDGDGNVVVNTNEFTHPDLTPMAQVVTRGGRIITLIDRRPELGGSSAGGGGQITFPQILGVILQGQVPLGVVKQWEGSLAINFTQLTGIATKTQLPPSIAYEDEANVFSQPQTFQDIFVSNGFGIVVGHTAQVDFGATPEFQVLGTATPDSSMGFARFENNASGPDVRFLKSRGETIGANVIVQDGDTIGRVRFQAADGNDFNTPAAEILAQIDGTPGVNDMPGRLLFRTTPDGGSSVVTWLTIDSAGLATFASDISAVNVTLSGQLIMSAIASQIVPGATSWALRNNADSANNIIVTNAGAVTFRSTVGGITTLTAATGIFTMAAVVRIRLDLDDGTANSPNINFITTSGSRLMDMDGSTIRILNLVASNARLSLTDDGNLGIDGSGIFGANVIVATNLTCSGIGDIGDGAIANFRDLFLDGDISVVNGLFSGQLIMSAGVSQLVPGATSFAIRDNGDANDNFLVEDDGDATVRKDIVAVTAILSGGLGANQVTKTANYTLTDDDFTVFGDASGGAFTLFLPTAVGRDGKIYVLQKIEGSANAVTVDADGSETINGLTTQPLNSIDDSIMIQSNGANWRII